MLVHSLLIKGVHLRRLGRSAGGHDFFGDKCDGCPLSPGKKKRGPLACKSVCDSTTDRTSGSVDDGNLVFQHHISTPSWGAPARPSRGIAWLAAYGLQRVRRLRNVNSSQPSVAVVKSPAAQCLRRTATDHVLGDEFARPGSSYLHGRR